ncbi:MAG: hypothetical protein EBY18_23535, partial [Alphaproteobacteria bacterium]|nr:hypothetical protein [Alphaproteobacteria bacterium]
AEKKATIDDSYKQKQATVEAESNRWITVKADIFNAKAAVDSSKDSMNAISNLLLEMRTPVSLAGTAGEDRKAQVEIFNNKLLSINGEADRMGRAFNLIGSINRVDYTPNKIEYRNDLGVGKTTLTGGYAGSDYRIEATDGSVWIPDLGSNTLTQYSELQGQKQKVTLTGDDGKPITIDKTASYTNGLSVTSYDPKTGAITMSVTIVPESGPITVNGTLKKNGLGLMPAWFYDGLATDAGRKRAYTDINEAESQLTIASAKVQQAAGQVSMDTRKVDGALETLNKQNTKALVTQLEESQKLQTEYVQQVQAMQNNLDQLSRQQQNYLQAFSSQIADGGFLDIML